MTERPSSHGLPPRVKAYVISLPGAIERRESVCRQLESSSVDWEIVDAVQAAGAEVREILDRCRESDLWHKPLQSGEVACYLSHRQVWQRMMEEGVDGAIILEDDFELTRPLDEVVSLLSGFATQADMIKLYGVPKISRVVETATDGRGTHALLEAFAVTSGTVGQWVSAKSVARLLARSETIRRPIDMDLKHHWEFPITVYHLSPPVVHEISSSLGGSSIAHRRSRKTLAMQLKRWKLKARFYLQSLKHYYGKS
jgi:glycosyl transferase family 25